MYIPCKQDSSLFYLESWGPGSVYCGEPDSATSFCWVLVLCVWARLSYILLLSLCAVRVSQTQLHPSAESLSCEKWARSSGVLWLGPCTVCWEPNSFIFFRWVSVPCGVGAWLSLSTESCGCTVGTESISRAESISFLTLKQLRKPLKTFFGTFFKVRSKLA